MILYFVDLIIVFVDFVSHETAEVEFVSYPFSIDQFWFRKDPDSKVSFYFVEMVARSVVQAVVQTVGQAVVNAVI